MSNMIKHHQSTTCTYISKTISFFCSCLISAHLGFFWAPLKMSAEIVVTEPIQEISYEQGEASTSRGPAFTRTRSITYDRQQYVPEPFGSERLPVTLASEIRRFLRVANQIENEEPRAAYLCRFHAFERAHNMDKNSAGRGIRQFKTALLQRLE